MLYIALHKKLLMPRDQQQEAVDAAALEMQRGCMRNKGSTGYILSLGPILSTMTSFICLLSLCRWFQVWGLVFRV